MTEDDDRRDVRQIEGEIHSMTIYNVNTFMYMVLFLCTDQIHLLTISHRHRLVHFLGSIKCTSKMSNAQYTTT